MKLLFDIHTHTVASGHAYSTLQENIAAAKKAGLLAYGFSDHAEKMPGSVKNIYFSNLKAVPREIDGLKIYGGVEANIVDYSGKIDVADAIAAKVDYIIASLHIPCVNPGSVEENTAALLGVMKNPYVKIIGHPDDGRYPIDMETFIDACLKEGVIPELNNASVKPGSFRVDGRIHAKEMLMTCKKKGCHIICNTDSHVSYSIGDFSYVLELLKETSFPEELVINTDMNKIDMVMNK